MRTVLTLALLPMALSGCFGSDPVRPPPPPTEIRIPVPVPCLTDGQVPAKPQFVTDAELGALGAYEFVTALHLDRLKRQNYEGKLEAAISACK